MKHFIYHFISILHGLIRTHKWPALNVSGFIAQLVRASHRYREVTGSNPVEVLTFSGFYTQLLKLCFNCDDHSSLNNLYLQPEGLFCEGRSSNGVGQMHFEKRLWLPPNGHQWSQSTAAKPDVFDLGKGQTTPHHTYSLRIVCGSFNVPKLFATRIVRRPPAYSPYPRRLKSLTICRCSYKGSTFYSVILRWSVGVELTTSRMTARCSTNWATGARFDISLSLILHPFIKKEKLLVAMVTTYTRERTCKKSSRWTYIG